MSGLSISSAAALCGLAAAACLAAAPVQAQEVDVQLVLAADVSSSMSSEELRIQREGYASALRSHRVAQAVLSGALGRAAITYVEWAAADEQIVVVPWTVVGSGTDLAAFAGRIAHGPELATARPATALSAALLFAARLFDGSGFASLSRVIDISGDGPDDKGPPPEEVRDAIVAAGITINAVAIALPDPDGNGPYAYFYGVACEEISRYYERKVIGGPGAFAMAVSSLDDFSGTLERKLVLEIAGYAPAGRTVPPASLALLGD